MVEDHAGASVAWAQWARYHQAGGGPGGVWSLTAVAAHVYLQGAGTGAAFAALGEGADTLVGVWLLGLLLSSGCGRGAGILAAGTVVQEVSLQVPLAAVPDATVLAGEDIFCGGKSWVKPEGTFWKQRGAPVTQGEAVDSAKRGLCPGCLWRLPALSCGFVTWLSPSHHCCPFKTPGALSMDFQDALCVPFNSEPHKEMAVASWGVHGRSMDTLVDTRRSETGV